VVRGVGEVEEIGRGDREVAMGRRRPNWFILGVHERGMRNLVHYVIGEMMKILDLRGIQDDILNRNRLGRDFQGKKSMKGESSIQRSVQKSIIPSFTFQ
jgi:hypothetical protein